MYKLDYLEYKTQVPTWIKKFFIFYIWDNIENSCLYGIKIVTKTFIK